METINAFVEKDVYNQLLGILSTLLLQHIPQSAGFDRKELVANDFVLDLVRIFGIVEEQKGMVYIMKNLRQRCSHIKHWIRVIVLLNLRNVVASNANWRSSKLLQFVRCDATVNTIYEQLHRLTMCCKKILEDIEPNCNIYWDLIDCNGSFTYKGNRFSLTKIAHAVGTLLVKVEECFDAFFERTEHRNCNIIHNVVDDINNATPGLDLLQQQDPNNIVMWATSSYGFDTHTMLESESCSKTKLKQATILLR